MASGKMTHHGCGGEIILGDLEKYDYEHDDGTISKVPELVCAKCGVEVIGDPEIDMEELPPR